MFDKQQMAAHFDRLANLRDTWFDRNYLYHEQTIKVCRPFLNPDSRVLELGCNTGRLLAALNPAHGVGVDISQKSLDVARERYPNMEWIHADVEALPSHPALAEPFDIIIMEDLVGHLWDIEQFFKDLRRLTHSGTRLVVSCWNWMWEPVLRLSEQIGVKAPNLDVHENWLSPYALTSFLKLGDFEVVQQQPGILMPYQLPVLTDLINSLSYAPVLDRFVLSTILVARPDPDPVCTKYSVSVIIPTRNEAGNIAALMERTPDMGSHTELIFVDGNSTDGTIDEIERQIAAHPERDAKLIHQVPPRSEHDNTSPNLMLKLGKGDAVRKGFAAASGDILMILDSDISVAPESLTKFYEVMATGKARFANGTRFAYEQENEAMRSLNRAGNIFFSLLFTWLLGQRITDTLCGTKTLFRQDYEAIVANRKRFGDFDPFGDFDLLFGAAWLRQPIVDVPVRYWARVYGESKVRVSMHGPLLIQMSLIALWHFKVKPLFTQEKQITPVADVVGDVRRPASRLPLLILAALTALFLLTKMRRKD